MIITVTNEWFITKFFHPEDTVNYQVYFRIFHLLVAYSFYLWRHYGLP